MTERLKKYYPFTGKKSPYVIHPDPISSRSSSHSKLNSSTMADKEYIRYTVNDWERNKVNSFSNSKTLRLLLIICTCIAITVLLRQCALVDRALQSGKGGVEHIQIILVGEDETDQFGLGHHNNLKPISTDTDTDDDSFSSKIILFLVHK